MKINWGFPTSLHSFSLFIDLNKNLRVFSFKVNKTTRRYTDSSVTKAGEYAFRVGQVRYANEVRRKGHVKS